MYDRHVAHWFAHAHGCELTGFITDCWGGYWQARSEWGPYTFRL